MASSLLMKLTAPIGAAVFIEAVQAEAGQYSHLFHDDHDADEPLERTWK